MVYELRHFENNFQIVASLGWGLVIIGIVILFTGPIPAGFLFIIIGAILIWIQLRGKRIYVNTKTKIVKSQGETFKISDPLMIFMREIRVSQNVNSRVSTTNVKMYFYKGYLQDGESKILISCNRNEKRDMEKLKQIASDLNIPFQLNYQ